MKQSAPEQASTKGAASARRVFLAIGLVATLPGCVATQPGRQAQIVPGAFDPRLGVRASPKLVPDGEPIPPGGGIYLVGRPYVVAGRRYFPNERPFSGVGMASWYGAAFQGRRTANGEIFDRMAVAAAHPTMPLPSYARVTNLNNNRSIIVRVNDRGPYAAGRVMDVSERVAELLDFKRSGTSRVKVEYVGRADLAGGDSERLAATLRTDGTLASLDGMPGEFAQAPPAWPVVADAASNPPPGPAPVASAAPAAAPEAKVQLASAAEDSQGTTDVPRNAPLPPVRPFDLADGAKDKPEFTLLAFAPSEASGSTAPVPVPRPDTAASYYAEQDDPGQFLSGTGPFGGLRPSLFLPLAGR